MASDPCGQEAAGQLTVIAEYEVFVVQRWETDTAVGEADAALQRRGRDESGSMLSDEALYEQYINGDDTALDALLMRYREGLTLFLMGFVRDIRDAEDLMMETFAMLLAREVTFGRRSSFRTWLFGIGRNLARNQVRRSLLRRTEPIPEKLPDDAEQEAEFTCLRQEQRRTLYAALNTLNEDYRTVLHLQYFEDMSPAEAAAVMKKTEKQVYNLTARAKQSLKRALERMGFNYDGD